MAIKISPSVLSADLADLKKDIKRIEESGADRIHFDVMDGIFVDNISFGIPVLKSVSECTDMFLDVHLMIIDPLKYIDAFVDAGADMITFHAESESDISATIEKILSRGIGAGLTIRPKTPVEVMFPYLSKLSNALVMSVEPGFGGQGFIAETMSKVTALRKEIDRNGYKCQVQVDGGINAETAKIAIAAGADDLVSGSYLFKAPDMEKVVEGLRLPD
ncbi:MAG: ribulose-phosphate 3-epimerase [Ruminococcus sp.]|nr:ribulose-phosphate 3-epimerase [Ruminococcus sp.]